MSYVLEYHNYPFSQRPPPNSPQRTVYKLFAMLVISCVHHWCGCQLWQSHPHIEYLQYTSIWTSQQICSEYEWIASPHTKRSERRLYRLKYFRYTIPIYYGRLTRLAPLPCSNRLLYAHARYINDIFLAMLPKKKTRLNEKKSTTTTLFYVIEQNAMSIYLLWEWVFLFVCSVIHLLNMLDKWMHVLAIRALQYMKFTWIYKRLQWINWLFIYKGGRTIFMLVRFRCGPFRFSPYRIFHYLSSSFHLRITYLCEKNKYVSQMNFALFYHSSSSIRTPDITILFHINWIIWWIGIL